MAPNKYFWLMDSLKTAHPVGMHLEVAVCGMSAIQDIIEHSGKRLLVVVAVAVAMGDIPKLMRMKIRSVATV